MSADSSVQKRFSLAALMGVIVACAVLFGSLARMESRTQMTIQDSVLPASDAELVAWLEKSARVHDVSVSRENDVVNVQFTKRSGNFEIPSPPWAELGYSGFRKTNWTVSQTSIFGAALRMISRIPAMIWIPLVVVSLFWMVWKVRRAN